MFGITHMARERCAVQILLAPGSAAGATMREGSAPASLNWNCCAPSNRPSESIAGDSPSRWLVAAKDDGSSAQVTFGRASYGNARRPIWKIPGGPCNL